MTIYLIPTTKESMDICFACDPNGPGGGIIYDKFQFHLCRKGNCIHELHKKDLRKSDIITLLEASGDRKGKERISIREIR